MIIGIRGAPGGDFGGPEIVCSGNRSSGKPLLLLRLKSGPPTSPSYVCFRNKLTLTIMVDQPILGSSLLEKPRGGVGTNLHDYLLKRTS